jgi:hypothetical protein
MCSRWEVKPNEQQRTKRCCVAVNWTRGTANGSDVSGDSGTWPVWQKRARVTGFQHVECGLFNCLIISEPTRNERIVEP